MRHDRTTGRRTAELGSPRMAATSPARATRLRVDWRDAPLGIDRHPPRFSWWVGDDRPGAAQTAYRIRVAGQRDALTTAPDLVDTGRVETSEQVAIEVEGLELRSRQRAWWDVTLWDHDGVEGAPSEPSTFEFGLLDRSDWSASWIGTPIEEAAETFPPAPVLFRSFDAGGDVDAARLYITALGIYDAVLNGRPIGDDWFRPGWTDYTKRVQYQTYDVSDLLRPGRNVLAVTLGDGWYSGRIAWHDRGEVYGTSPALLAQLEATNGNGTTTVVAATDDSWSWVLGPVRYQDFLDGEHFDARRAVDMAHPDEAGAAPVVVRPWPDTELVAQPNEPVRAITELPPIAPPQRVSIPAKRIASVFDLGQNFTGVVRLKVRGPGGASVRLRYAEMLQPDGKLYTENLRTARATDWYTLRGDADGETWTARFTFHGFRYVEVSYSHVWRDQFADFDESTITGVALSSALEATGRFACSDERVNKLQSNIQWGQRSNFLEVPTDCPQRDERLGWTGDAQVFASTAAYNMDVASFFAKWSVDLDDAETPEGRVPRVAPSVVEQVAGDGGPGWSDARVLCAWAMYQAYGDTGFLERHYEPMVRWVEWEAGTANDGVRCEPDCGYFPGFSDWLSLDATWQATISATPRDFIGTAYFAYSAGVMSEIASILGRTADAERFARHRARSVEAFNRNWVTPSGRLAVQTQTAHLMALAWDLLPADQRPGVFDRLLELLAERGWHLSTGFLGTPLLCPVLTRFGRVDIAYQLLLDEDYPGWLFPVKHGATTMWERWNSWTPDGGFGSVGMNSFNHYAYGAVGAWMYETIGGIGIDPERPGYSHIRIAPLPDARLGWAEAELQSPRGLVSCRWEISGDTIAVDAVVPANATATLHLPGHEPEEVAAGRHHRETPVPKTSP